MARNLTRHERILARHYLQVLSEQALTVRNAMDPEWGMLGVTDEAWAEQWAALTKDLDAYTENVRAGRETSGLWPGGDRNA